MNNHLRPNDMHDYWQIQIHCEDNPEKWIRDTVETINIITAADGTTILTVSLPDISAVYGLLLQLRDTQVSLISLQVEHIDSIE